MARDLATGLLSDRDDLSAYPELVLAWARAEARTLLLADWFVQRGLFDDEGAERPGVRFIHQFERLAADLRAQLGLTPGSEADLARARTDAVRGQFDLEAIAATGRQARLAAEQRQALAAAASSGEGPAHLGAVGDAECADGGEGDVDGALPATTDEP